MGAPSKDLWIMLIICIPLILLQALPFARSNIQPTAGLILRAVILFELIFVGTGAYYVWKYGSFAEAVTRVLEATRIWDINPRSVETGRQIPQATKFCRYCGTRIPRESTICEGCGSKLR